MHLRSRRWAVLVVAAMVGAVAVTATAEAAPVVKVASTTTLAVDAPASFAGQAVTLQATVSAPAAPTGKVAFQSGSRSLGTATVAAGIATLVTRKLPVGPLALTAQYKGSSTVLASTSDVVPGSVVKASTSMSLVVDDLAPSVGGAVHVTARVTVDARSTLALKGKVKLTRGTKVVKAVKLVNGVAAVSLPVSARTPTPGGSVPAGPLDLSASYKGTKLLGASSASHPTQATTTTITPPGPARAGEPLTLRATVDRVGASSGPPIGGTVSFLTGATVLGAAPVAAGTASIVTTALSVGDHVVRAEYSGAPSYGSSASAGIEVAIDAGPAATTTHLSADANVVVSGEPVTFAVSVTSAEPGVPSGTVELRDGATVLGTVPLTGGTAELSPVLAEGEHTVVATYSGDGAFTGSVSDPEVVLVVPAPDPATTTSLESSANPALAGDPVTFTATVSPSQAGTPTGSVELREGEVVLGSSPLVDGAATIVVSSLPIGTHALVAVYGGDGTYAGSVSEPVEQVIEGRPTVVEGGTTGPTSFGGSMDVFAQVVAPGGGTPTGSVTFTEGDVVVGSGQVGTFALGYAGFSTSTLTVGTHTLRATYVGDSSFAPSQSATFEAVVTKRPVELTVDQSTESSTAGDLVTFTITATAVPPTDPVPTGTVVVRDNGTVVASDLELTGGVAVFQTDGLTPGSHMIEVDYGGDAVTVGASRQVEHLVVGFPSFVGLVVTPNPVDVGEPLTLGAGIMAGGGPAVGVVEFRDGPTLLGVAPIDGGSATLVVSDLAAGPHSITATFPGDTIHDPSTSLPTEVFVRYPVTIDLVASASPTATRDYATFIATLSSAEGAPTGSVSFEADSCTIDGSAALSLGTAMTGWNPQLTCGGTTAAPGSHTITARYPGDATHAPASTTISHELQSVVEGWGRNFAGQVGDGTTTLRTSPARAGLGYAQVSAGIDFSLGIRDDGALFAWGTNFVGQLGLGTTDGAAHPSPTRVGTATWKTVAAGRRHVLGIQADGSLWNWGEIFRQFIDGGFMTLPAPVRIGSDTDWRAVAAGSTTSFAIKTDGSLWAWGSNSSGSLGDGTTVPRYSPVRVGTDSNWATVAADGSHAYGIRTDGTLWAWGLGEPHLGDGSGPGTQYLVPTRIGLGTNWRAVSTSIGNTIALNAVGEVWGWGDNTRAALGDWTLAGHSAPWPVILGGTVVAISLRGNGGDHGLALTHDRRVYAWGNNTFGQTGTGSADETVLTPTRVPGRFFSTISAGGDHSLATG